MQVSNKIAFKSLVSTVVFTLLLATIWPVSPGALTVKEEEELGQQVLKAVFRRFEVVDDPYLRNYVNTIGRRILAKMPEQPFRYRFYVIKEDSYNAFAIPAGYVFINSGLFASMETEEELAGILGHEISHVYARHISEKIERSKKIGMASMAGVAAGILLGAAGAGEAATAVTMGAAGAGATAELAYSRDNEMQADQLGLKILTEAGYNGAGLLKVLRQIRSKKWFTNEQFPTYLSTHPAVEDRLAYIDSWLATQANEGLTPPAVDPAEFDRMVARLRINYGDEEKVLNDYGAALRNSPEDPLANYHYGMILARLDKRQEAISYLKKALAKRAFDPFILRDLAKVYFLDGQFEQALKLLKSVQSAHPADPDTLFYLGRTHMELGELEQATEFFTVLVEKEPLYRQAYYFLGKSFSGQGRPGEAAANVGVYYWQGQDYRNAALQWNQALKHLKDPDRRKQVEGYLKKAQRQLEPSGSKPG